MPCDHHRCSSSRSTRSSRIIYRSVVPWLLAVALLSIPSAHADTMSPIPDGAVVRVATLDPADLDELRAVADFWGIDREAEEAVVWATAEEQRALAALGFETRIDTEATERYLAAAVGSEAAGKGSGIPGFPCYRTVEETYADLAQLAAENPQLASWVDIGDSWEKINGPGAGYDIRALVLTNSEIPGPKPPLVIIAAMHAREYTTAELATRFAESLVAGYGTDADSTWLLDHHEIHIVPHLNPDGRKRAEAGASWRKNVNNDHCTGSSFRGVDLNRNSSFLWGGSASSGNPCSELYRGPSAASELETDAIESYMALVFDDQRGGDLGDPAPLTTQGVFLSLHSFSELVLFPWEATATETPNHAGLRTLGRRFGFFNGYGICLECLGTADGTSVDQAYGEYGVASYTFELGTTFFQSCGVFENTILPDNLPALRLAAKAARAPYAAPAGPAIVTPMLDQDTVSAGTAVTLDAVADDTRFASGGFGNEPTQNVVAAEMSIDTPPWLVAGGLAMAAVDGVFDETVESVTLTLDTSALPPGRHTLYLWAEDAAGNRGLPSAVFLTITEPPLFADGFESGDTGAWSGVVGF